MTKSIGADLDLDVAIYVIKAIHEVLAEPAELRVIAMAGVGRDRLAEPVGRYLDRCLSTGKLDH